jgi:hypothetical protein
LSEIISITEEEEDYDVMNDDTNKPKKTTKTTSKPLNDTGRKTYETTEKIIDGQA